MLRADGIGHGYRTDGRYLPVLRGVDLTVTAGVRVGLEGPSGCGKSTLARVLALLERPESGRVLLDGSPVSGAGPAVPPGLRRRVQLLWQSPRLAVDPRYRLRRIIAEPLRIHGELPPDGGENSAVIRELAHRVGLTEDLLDRHPNEVSDGQLQRACLGRALVLRPEVLIVDELGAMLDVSTQAALLAVLAEETQRGMAVLLVSHDATLLRHWCDEVLRLRDGELGTARAVPAAHPDTGQGISRR